MKKLLIVSLLLFSINSVFGGNYLTVGDVRNVWWTEQGTIEEASLSVRPAGLYLEYGLYLTFSSRGSSWTSNTDSLEVVLNFDLPENAIIHDSWLWIGNDIVRARIMDKWTASSLYENIVKRRRDPSILTKQTSTHYELRIFPMAGNQTRKAKITWLMPQTWGKTIVKSTLPTNILKTSRIIPDNFPLIVYTNDRWKNPQIAGDASVEFWSKSDPVLGNYLQANIPASKFENISIGFESPMKDGYYLSRSENGNDGIYQLAVMPDVLLDSAMVRKVTVLVDYDASNTTLSGSDVISALKAELLNNLSPRDSFNLIFSNLSITRYSEKWVAATAENISAAFSGLGNPLSSYSNLASLVGNGIDFVKRHGNDGKLILISDADQYGDYQVANKLINDILVLMNPKMQIHVVDYQTLNFPYYYINGNYYQGNAYLYSNLSRITSGSFQRVDEGLSLSGAIGESVKYTSGSLSSFDLYTSVQSGFCYARYNLTGNSNLVYMNTPILQVGKYKGSFPLSVEISGEYQNKLFSQKIEIADVEPDDADSISEKIWIGQYIKELELGPQRNDVINEIIYSSTENRVLSRYTAFLCLENLNQVCYNCIDESKAVGVDELKGHADSLKVYPNPFSENLTIELWTRNNDKIEELAVYNLLGSRIYQFDLATICPGNNVIVWNGTDASDRKVEPGIYLLSYRTNEGTQTIRLVKR